jgi:hypothetical protein
MLSRISPIINPSTPEQRLHDDICQARELLALLWQARVDRDSWVKRWRLLVYLQRTERRIRVAIENGDLSEFPVERLRSILALLSEGGSFGHVIADSARDGLQLGEQPIMRLRIALGSEARAINDDALIVSGHRAGQSKASPVKISARDRYCLKRYKAGDLLKNIQTSVAKLGWELLDSPQAVRAVVVRTARRLGEPIPRRRRH